MSDRAAEPVVVKQEPEFQEVVLSLGSPETQQVDAGPLGLLLQVKLEPETEECSVKQEIDLGPTVLYKPLSFPAPQVHVLVKEEVAQPDGTPPCRDDNYSENNSELRVRRNRLSRKSVLIAHTAEKVYSCSNCQYKCLKKHHLFEHMRTHTGEKPYSCNNCQYKCSRKSNLVRHMRKHAGENPYSCNSCEYKCSIKHNLVRHMRTHAGQHPYSCSNCQYKCLRKQRLVQHMRTHTGEKPYSCNNCEYKCSIKPNLVRHMRTHAEEKPYSCSNCQYKCLRKEYLVQHVKFRCYANVVFLPRPALRTY